ncbi:MAG TPA: putative lipid II flippase FtsW [Nitrospirae bacterium]|nr:lipid II flippase FtsW [bacterium BMS3Abin09]GBE40810.1 lipid II flippase FtsW [bacterium BMS3Bbin09]HDH34710.1 putative lipid II flippase FtsW [Nitrospirota bacterium]HDN94637.1 putative lipid II flippase FtsW [Nitrospirota bacterium]HDO67330.1 putative lipid II flippase FtsW [Nitrospirota bacterium]
MNSRYTRDIVISVMLLVCIGTVMVYSSTALMSMRKYGSGSHYLWNHIFTLCVGIAAMLILSRTDYKKFRSFVYIMMGFSLFLILLVFVPWIGISANGARRWLRLWPTTFQPSELVKLVMVIFLADYMDKNIHRMREFKYGILIPVVIMLIFQGIIIAQPDFGAVMSLGILTVGLLILGGARLSHIGALVLSSLPVIYIVVSSSSYRMKRIMSFTNPWKDSFGDGFQLVQSFIAFGSGGFFGVGLGGSKQKLYFLPEVHTDFIFSLISEELGLIGALTVVGIFVWFFIRGVQVSLRTSDPFSYFLTMGLTMMIGVQAVINFAVSMGLMPTKGLPLPFISYGGSALLINMCAAAILISISRQNENNAYNSNPVYNTHRRSRR